ncbi:hypothetical protein GpartN1_g147.t1 [Galdieria partita]|uniref:Nuclear pore complex protein Nup88 n=1 Tax=Galdieria partita TaxID=83374 RepID=A0A9C7PR81_9RHOD|nr:hypothetical protein GpartN1_g147.t1 [Galdieria partita]
MKASEWIQSVQKLVKEDKNIINKPVKLFGSCLVGLNRDYYLLLLSQNVCYLLENKQDSFPTAFQVQWSLLLSFEATAIRLHPNGNLGALVGERGVACFSIDISSLKWKVFNRQVMIDVVEIGRSRSHDGMFDLRSDLTVVDVCWHPSSISHLCLLTSDNTLWFWNVLTDVEEEEQRLSMKMPDNSSVVSFCFGTGPGWEFFTIYLANSKGEVYYLCPVYPFGCCISLQLLNSLRKQVEARYGVNIEEKGPTSQKLTFSTSEKEEWIENKLSSFRMQPSFDSNELAMSENTVTIESTRQQYLFLEECWMACEVDDNIIRGKGRRGSSSFLSLGKTMSRWEPSLQGPIVIEKDKKSGFYEGEDYCLCVLDSTGPFPVLIHTSSSGYVRIYIQLGQLEPLFTISHTSKGMDRDIQLSSENAVHFVLFENIELFPYVRQESLCPIVFRDFGELDWYRNKWISNDLKEYGDIFFIGTESQLFLLRIPWLHVSFEELSAGADWNKSKIQLLATIPNTLENDSSTDFYFLVRGVTFFVETECLGVIINFGNDHMIWIPLIHCPPKSRPWDQWSFMASELDTMLKQEDEETIHSQRPLEKRCEELLQVISKPPRYAGDQKLTGVQLEAGLRFLQDVVTKYREEYISNFEKLSLILSDALEKLPKGLEKVEKKLDKIQTLLKESQMQLANLEKRLTVCKRISKCLLERAQIIREALIEGRGRLSKAELAWKERLSVQWKEISHYQSQMEELKKAVQSASQGLVKESSEKFNCFTQEELDNIYESLNEHTVVLNKLFSMVTKLEQASSVKYYSNK